ncbi:MAG TPA: carboxypeptidase-like regulatory domain-containing protein [Candidatus Sulfotelmatobacter sp.]|nr:carboxypeptidase-like regulatory domain-containing protein [Candidatus Sulfotelmatobacter sp.]
MVGRHSLSSTRCGVSISRPRFRRILLAPLLLTGIALFSNAAWGQASTSLRGTITDPSGSTVAGARVVLASPESKTERAATTGDQGEYQFLFVPPGTYTLTATATGFQRYQIAGIQLLVNTPATINAQLKVGGATETVDVTSEQPALNLVDASIGNSFDETQVRQIPLEGRNVPDLLSLQAGVAYTGNRTDLDKDQDTRNGAVNGARSDQSNITLDGVDVNDQANGYAFTSVLPVTLDSVQEFRVTTTNYGADQGQGSGAQVALVTKSGTNQFHGTAYEYLRNTFTSANDYLVKTAELLDGQPNKPLKLNRNIFGASVGGPMKKDRSFFFLNYEGTRQREEHSVVRSIPTVAMRDGVIRYLCNSIQLPTAAPCTGGNVQGMSGAMYPVASGYWGISPYTGQGPNNLQTLDPLGIGPSSVMLNYFNQNFSNLVTNDFSVGDGLNYSGYRFRAPVKADNNVFIAKLDFHLDAAGKHTLFWRGALQNLSNPQEPFLPGTVPEQTIADHSKGLVLGYTAVLSSSMVNNLRWGFTRQSFGVVGDTNAQWNTFIGLDQGLAFSHNLQLPVNNFVDDFSWTKGTHSFQFGGNIGLTRNPRVSYLHSSNFTLGTSSWMSPTGIADSASPMDPTNLKLPGGLTAPEVDLSFKSGYDRPLIGLMGIVSDFVGQYNFDKSGNLLGQGSPVDRRYALNWYEMYAQDSWRAKQNLTVTYGVRWSLFPPPWETNGLQSASSFSLGKQFDTNVANMKQGMGYTSEPSIAFVPGGPVNHGPEFYHLSKTNFAPRISIAFSPRPTTDLGRKMFGDSDKTSIRGGFGLVYDRPGFQLLNSFDQYSPGGFGYTLQNTCCQVGVDDVGDLPRISNLNVIPPNLQLNLMGQPPFLTPAPSFSQKDIPFNSEANLWAVDDTLKTPRSYAVDFSIARELPGHYALQISYIGRFGGKLLTQRDLNQPLDIVDPKTGIDYYKAATALSQLARSNPGQFANSSTYQAFLATVTDAAIGPTAAYWHDVLPGLTNGASSYATYCSGGNVPTPGSAGLMQGVYDVYYNPNCAYVGNEIVGLADIDLYGYLGDNGIHTPYTNPLFFNGPLNFQGTGQGKYLNNQAISAFAWSTVGHSNYNALQASLRKQFSNGLQFDLNYTYSKSLDDTSTAARVGFALVGYQNIGLVGSRLENAFSPDSQYAVSDFDMTHQINANWLAELPFGKGKRFASSAGPAAEALIGGWQLTGVARWTSGLPFSVDVGQNWPTDWQYTGLAQLVGSKPHTGVYRQSNGSVTIFSNPSASQAEFVIPFPGSGASRNVLRGQGYAGLDLGLSKRWRFRETQSVQFTWQVFNVLNLVRFNAQGVGSAVTSIEQAPTQFGTYSSLLTYPRVMQFALRYEF